MKQNVRLLSAIRRVWAAALLVFSTAIPLLTPIAAHADLTKAMVRFDRMQTSTATTGTVCAMPATASTEADVQVTFPTGYTLGSAANFTVNTTNTAWPTGGTAWLGITTATNVTGQVVTFPSSDLVVGTLYCFNWTNSAAVTIKSSATDNNTGTITTRTSAPATIDSSGYTTSSISGDQITVSASVASTFQFALSGTSDNLGALTTGSVSTSPTPRTATVSTNAKNGWMVWAKDTNSGLKSPTTLATIASNPGNNSTLSAGTAGFNTGVTSTQVGGSGTITVATPYVGTATGQGGGLDTSLRLMASSDGPADTAVLTLKNNAAISNTTSPATDYTDTITVIGAGLF